MNRTKLTLFFVFLISTVSWADGNRLEFEWGRGEPKTSLNVGSSSDAAGERGTLWSADFLHYTKPLFAWGFEGGHFRSNDHDSATFVPSTQSTIDSKATSILGLIRFDLASRAPLIPYVMLGSGWVRNSFSVTSTPDSVWPDTSTSEQRTIVDQSRAAIAYMGALGVDANINDRWYVGLEGRFQDSTSKNFDLTPAGVRATGRTVIDSTLPVLSVSIKAGLRY